MSVQEGSGERVLGRVRGVERGTEGAQRAPRNVESQPLSITGRPLRTLLAVCTSRTYTRLRTYTPYLRKEAP